MNSETKFDNYINASYLNSCEQLKLFIAAQAPTEKTTADFLQMIFENNVTLVLMLCEFKVKGKEQCYRYLGKRHIDIHIASPGQSSEKKSAKEAPRSQTAAHFTTPDNLLEFKIEVIKEKKKFNQGLIIRKVKLTKKTFKSFENFVGVDSLDDEKSEDDPDYFNVTKPKSKGENEETKNPVEPKRFLEEVHYFKHVQDVVWEDHKPPTSRGDQATLNYLRMSYLVKLMMKYAKQPKVQHSLSAESGVSRQQRILVHCSAGRGRTGTLIAAYCIAETLFSISESLFNSVLPNSFPKERQEPDAYYLPDSFISTETSGSAAPSKTQWARVSVFAIVRRLREQRWQMVSTDQQYVYLYKFLSDWIRLGETAAVRELLSREERIKMHV